MVEDKDILASATQMIKLYGEAALMHCMLQAVKFRKREDERGRITWEMVGEAVRNIENSKRRPGFQT